MKKKVRTFLLVLGAVLLTGLVVWVGFLVVRSFLRYNPEAARRMGTGVPVKVAAAVVEELPEVIGATSLAEPMLTIDVKTQLAGRIKTVNVNIGQMVSKGAKLVELDPTLFVAALKSAEDDLAKAKTDLENNRLAWERTAYLYSQEVVAKVALEAADLILNTSQANYAKAQEALVSARYNMNHVNIFASEDGVVMKRPLSDRISSPGEVVANGDIVLSLGVMRSIMLAAQVPQEKIESVYLGQKAEIVFDSYPSLVLLGQVQKIDPQTDPQTRTFKAYIKVDAKPMPTGKKGTVSGLGVVPLDSSAKKGEVDYLASKLGAQPPPTQETAGSSPSKIPELKLTPGLSAYARLQHKRTMLTVPRLAVVKNAGESSVFVVENSTAHLRRIRTGVELSRNVEVLSGLKAGDQVVYYGLLALKDNDPVNLQALGNADEVQESNRRGK